MLEKTLESPLDCKEIQPVNPKENQFWIFIGRTDAEAEAPILWPPDAKNWLIGKDSDAGKDWRQEEKGTTEDEVVGWHHRLNGLEYNGQGSLACCSSWGRKELDTTERLNWTELSDSWEKILGKRYFLNNSIYWVLLFVGCYLKYFIWFIYLSLTKTFYNKIGTERFSNFSKVTQQICGKVWIWTMQFLSLYINNYNLSVHKRGK